MEYLEGEVLSDVLEKSGGLPASRAVSVARQLCNALAAIHALGFVYLDLSTTNIFLGGKAEAIDPQTTLFNIDLATAIGGTCIGRGGNFDEPIGSTVEYWSPEQSSGASVDVRSDIYSLGVLLAHASRAPKLGLAMVTLPQELASIVERCMANKPKDRFASASQLEEALACFDDKSVSSSARSGNISLSKSLALEAQGGEPLPSGTIIGSYRLLQLLGEGGMGFVYKAEHTRISRVVAIKMLRPEFAGNSQAVERFFSEAKAANQIAHENIVEITDFVENQDGNNYVIMELLKGMELSEPLSKGALALGRTLRITVQMCDALGAVHNAGIIHRDLKPDNVFLTKRAGQSDFVKILDFGIAKLTDTQGLSTNQTAAGAVFGTPEYMSPEQAKGEEVDHRSDIYSLGVILYEMVTGAKLFEAPTFAEVLVMHMKATPALPSTVSDLPHAIPVALEALILDCLSKDPESRPQEMEVIAERLRQVAEADSSLLESFVSDDHFSEDSYSDLPVQVSTRGKPSWLVAWAAIALLGTIAAYIATRSGGSSEESQLKEPAVPQEQATAVATPEPVQTDSLVPEATTVEVVFTSAPPGAGVFRVGSDLLLGNTPFTTSLTQSTEAVPFEFRLEGHDPMQKSIPLSADTNVVATLLSVTEGPGSETTEVAKGTEPERVSSADSGKKTTGKKTTGKKATGKKTTGKKATGKKGSRIKKGGIKDDLFAD
jgi:serine/threonine-protein kinase